MGGFGERTGCDIQAMLLGAVVLKPYMDWVLAFPDIYHSGRYYVPFQADASDLLERVAHVKGDYGSFRDMREQAQRFCMRYVDGRLFVDRFWAEACDAYVHHRAIRPYAGT